MAKRLRLLLVEDNPVNARLMQALLEKHGHQVVIEIDAPSAIARFEADPAFAGALVDLNLPGGGGVGVLAALRGRLRALAVTADTSPGIEARLLQQGFVGYLPKPVDPHRFALQVERLLVASPAPEAGPVVSFEELQARYRAKLPSLVEELARATEQDRALALSRAHDLAGLAGSFGFDRVTEAARRLERALATDEDAAALVAGLRDALAADLDATK